MSQHMKVILRIAGGLLLVGLVSLLVFYVLYAPVCSSGPEPAATPDSAWMPNPASAYCEEQGGRIEIRTTADGDQYGVCILPDGSECEEWAFYRNECTPGGKTGKAPELILAPIPAVLSPGQPIKVTGSGFAPEHLAVIAIWGVAGMLLALRFFSWEPRR